MQRSAQRARRPHPRLSRRWRSVHRWIGAVAALFLVLLCTTGIALNHAAGLGLDQRFTQQPWLLGLYGISGPAFGPSYAIDERWITVVDGHLYLDAREIERNAGEDVVGAVDLGEEIAVASSGELFLFSPDGDLLERSPLSGSLGGPVERIGTIPPDLFLATANGLFLYDPVVATTSARTDLPVTPAFSERRPLPAALRAAIEDRYRGQGISLDRLLYDLHSGRLLGLSGVVLMDLTALAVCVLALSGLLLFFRR